MALVVAANRGRQCLAAVPPIITAVCRRFRCPECSGVELEAALLFGYVDAVVVVITGVERGVVVTDKLGVVVHLLSKLLLLYFGLVDLVDDENGASQNHKRAIDNAAGDKEPAPTLTSHSDDLYEAENRRQVDMVIFRNEKSLKYGGRSCIFVESQSLALSLVVCDPLVRFDRSLGLLINQESLVGRWSTKNPSTNKREGGIVLLYTDADHPTHLRWHPFL